MDTSLIVVPIEKPNTSLRLICFPHAGGNAATYISWIHFLHPNIELAFVQMPGRGVRISESPYESMTDLIKNLFLAIQKLQGKPFIFFGHSMGACVAYELSLMLRRFGCQLPQHFIASACSAPNLMNKQKENTDKLNNDEFIKYVYSLNGLPEEIALNAELMEIVLPSLRADFKIIENYCSKMTGVLPTKISVFGGTEDNIPSESLTAWFKLFESNNGLHWLKGDHFFVEKNKISLLEKLNELVVREI